MAFSALYFFNIGDEVGKNSWLLEHYLEHRLMVDTLLGTYSFQAVDLPIQFMGDVNVWLADHQKMSQSVWTGFNGGQTTDLERVDWDDPQQVMDWFQIHRDWHYQARTTLGL